MKTLNHVPRKCPVCGTTERYEFPHGSMRLYRFACGQQVYWNHILASWVLDDQNLQGWGLCRRVAQPAGGDGQLGAE